MTGTMYKLLKERKGESERIGSAASKQSSWAKIGGGLLGALAIGVTGGAATPLVAAAMAGGGTLAGGLIGRGLARSTKGGKIKAGRFYEDEAAEAKKTIGADIWSSALSSGLKGGVGALAKGFSLGKEGLKFTGGAQGGGVNLADALGKDAPAMAGGYSDSLWGKLGKAIDFKGSFAGKGLQKLKTAQLGKEFADQGWIDPNLQTRVGGEPIVAMDRRIHSPVAKSARIDKMLQERGPFISPPGFDDVMSSGSSGRGFQEGILPGHSKVQYDVAQAKNAELVESLKGYQFGPIDGAPQPTSTKPLSSSLNWRDADVPQYDEFGSWTGGTQFRGDPAGLARELGKEGYGGPIRGESFPVSSPTEGSGMLFQDRLSPGAYGSEEVRAIGASQYSRGKISALDARRHKGMLDSVRWQDRLFGD